MSVPAPPEPGANPLDTPEVRDLIAASLDHPGVYMGGPSRQSKAKAERTIRDLAPHVAAAQRAAFRTGVEAAAECCDQYCADDEEMAWTAAATLGDKIRRLPVPAELAAPEPNDSLGVLSHGDED